MAFNWHMPGEKAMENVQTNDPYALVIADLRDKRTQIDQTIASLEALRSGGVGVGRATSSGAAVIEARRAPAATSGSLLGISIADAAKKILAANRRKMTTPELVAELQKGGVVLTATDKNNTVGSILLRRFYQNGDLVRVNRGEWGLQEWYPGRKFPGAKSKAGENGEADTATQKGPEPDNQAEQEGGDFDNLMIDAGSSSPPSPSIFGDDNDDDVEF